MSDLLFPTSLFEAPAAPPAPLSVPPPPPPVAKNVSKKPKASKPEKPSHSHPRPQRRSLIAEVEAELRRLRIPYVAVDEAKKALFSATKLKSFHFVVYSRSADKWLVWCGDPSPATKADMEQWQQVFGEGFCIVYALRRAGGIVYRSASGDTLSITSILHAPSDDESQVRQTP